MERLLTVQGLETYFYTSGSVIRAVDGVDFSIGKGETLGLVGETGCGKSATALSIMRLIHFPPGRIVNGSILFEGKDLLKLEERDVREKIRGKKISMIFQEPRSSMNPVFRIGQQITEVIRLHQKLSRQKAVRKAIEMLELVKIPEAGRTMRCYPHELSGGMLQRAMIALELACNPLLFIADEPTTALDVTIQAQILNLMKKIQTEMNMAILLISHDLGVVAQLCQYVAVMYAGRMVEYAPVEEIFEKALHPYTRSLFNSVVGLGKRGEKLDTIPGDVPDLRDPPEGCRFHPRCAEVKDRCRRERPPSVRVGLNHSIVCHR